MVNSQFFSVSLLGIDDFGEVPIVFVILMGLFVLKLAVFYFMMDWFFAWQRVRRHPITAEFKPPLDLNPAEVSFAFKPKLDKRDFAGLLVHMAQRGIVHFRKHKGQKIVLPGPRHINGLKYYEKLILKTVVENRNVTSANLVEYHHTMFSGGHTYKTFTGQVLHALQEKGFYAKTYRWKYLWALVRTTLATLGILVWFSLTSMWVYNAVAEGTSNLDSIVDLGYSLVAYSTMLFVPVLFVVVITKFYTSRYVGRKGVTQKKLNKFWAHIIGFRQYVVLIEHNKLHFDNEVLKRKSSVNTLPYAIALGTVDNWEEIVM